MYTKVWRLICFCMNKKIYLIAGIIALLLVLIWFTISGQDFEPGTITDVAYTDLNVTFRPSNGSDIIADNFLKNPTVKANEQNPGFYELGNTFPPEQSSASQSNYVIMFDKVTGTFGVSLLQKPFSKSRLEAETYLKDLLKIDEKEMCVLSYTVAVPGYVDQNASGQDYRFSFCADAVQL